MGAAPRVTITDVAKTAGVSKVTVSYVLNGQAAAARISEATRERVLKVADELGYSPSAIARSMVTKRSDTLGVVFQFGQYFATTTDFVREVMLEVSRAAVDSGFDLMLHTRPVPDARAEVAALTDGRVDGVLILRDDDDATLQTLIERRFPAVLFCSRSQDPNSAWVDSDNYNGAKEAVEYLVSLGHKKLAMVCGQPHATSAIDRRGGFVDVVKGAGLSLPESHLVHAPTEDHSEAIQSLLNGPDRPTAIFCFSDDLALQTLRLAIQSGIRVPEELSIVGFDSLQAAQNAAPGLTSVYQPVSDIVNRATDLLIRIVRDEAIVERQVIFPTRLDIRGTTSRPPSS